MKLWSGLVVSAFVLTALASCGDDTEAYCEDLEDANQTISAVDEGDIVKYPEAIPKIQELKDEAPDNVASDWGTFDKYMQAAQSYYEDIEKLSDNADDVTMDDIWDLHDNKPDEDNPKVQKASENIRKDAKSTCELDLKK